MTFVALADQVSLILQHLEYSSLSPGDPDEIVVRVSDGAGGACLDQAEHLEHQLAVSGDATFTTIRDGCFQIQASIIVPGYDTRNPNNNNNANGNGGFFSFVSIPDLLFWGLVILIIACCGSCLRQCPSCMAHGAAIEVDDDEDSSVEVTAKAHEQV